MSFCGNKRAPVEHVTLFFVFRGHLFLKCKYCERFRRCVDPCQRFLTPDDTHTTYAFCVWDKLRVRALCSRGNGVRSVRCELFSFFFPLSFIPFLERIWSIIWPPRLGSSRCWGSNETEIGGDRRWSMLTCFREELISRARRRLTRVNCWRRIYCPYIIWSSRKCSAVISELSQPVCPVYEELLEDMEHATVRLDLQ